MPSNHCTAKWVPERKENIYTIRQKRITDTYYQPVFNRNSNCAPLEGKDIRRRHKTPENEKRKPKWDILFPQVCSFYY